VFVRRGFGYQWDSSSDNTKGGSPSRPTERIPGPNIEKRKSPEEKVFNFLLFVAFHDPRYKLIKQHVNLRVLLLVLTAEIELSFIGRLAILGGKKVPQTSEFGMKQRRMAPKADGADGREVGYEEEERTHE
jgi:hypothetical protein